MSVCLCVTYFCRSFSTAKYFKPSSRFYCPYFFLFHNLRDGNN